MIRSVRSTVFSLLLLLAHGALAEVSLRATSGREVLDGNSPHLLIAGLKSGEVVTVHSFRKSAVFEPGTYKEIPVIAHAMAVFTADGKGTVNLDSAAPIRGTYTGADPLGLLWSGTRMELAGASGQPVTQGVVLQGRQDVVLRVEAASLGEKKWLESSVQLTDGAESVEVKEVVTPGLNGFFARPKVPSGKALPAIILLHGSEGGSKDGARETAIRFAQLGYAAFAQNYFSWDPSLTGIPHVFVDIPVEEVAAARTWLMQQPGVDARTVAVWGASKGAELALLAASHYEWIDRVVGCVPSSVVWSGFGRPPVAGEVYSSWSINGVGLPYIPYDNYDDVLQGRFSAAYVHKRSLDIAPPEQRKAARIPIENTHAKLLLLAAKKDVVWPSAILTGEIEASLHEAHKDQIAQAIIFPEASHYICGTGSETRRINLVHKPEGDDPTPEADAYAAAAGWRETRKFLQR